MRHLILVSLILCTAIKAAQHNQDNSANHILSDETELAFVHANIVNEYVSPFTFGENRSFTAPTWNLNGDQENTENIYWLNDEILKCIAQKGQ